MPAATSTLMPAATSTLMPAATSTVAPAPPPTYLVERIVTVGEDSRRLSVFRDGTAVLVRRVGRTVVEELRRELAILEQDALGKVVAECAAEFDRAGVFDRGPGDGTVQFRLAPPGREPRSWTLPLAAVPNLATARLASVLDGLERALAAQGASRGELGTWQATPGDRLELEDGRIVTILEVHDTESGAVAKVQVGAGPLTFFTAIVDLRRMAVRRLEP